MFMFFARPAVARYVVVVALGLTLTACGNATDGEPSARQTATNGDVYNAADVTFATQMIQHHAQAVKMVVMCQGRPLDPEVRRLADAIRDAQVTEVETMVQWLTAWGQEIPETTLDHANAGHGGDGMGHGGGMDGDMGPEGTGPEGRDDMPGMMSDARMQELADASDEEFQDLWLKMMIEHHGGAIDMAKDEQSNGVFKHAVRMARRIVSAQQSEIDLMQGMLGQ